MTAAHDSQVSPTAELADVDNGAELDESTAEVGAWLVSIIVHAIVLALLVLVYFMTPNHDHATVRPALIEAPPEVEDPPEHSFMKDIEVEIDPEVVDEEEILVPEFDVEFEPIESTEDDALEDAVAGHEANASSALSDSGVAMAIGSGNNASGLIGARKRGRTVGRGNPNGPTRATEGSVEAALRWFMRHQSPDGSWDVDGYPVNCRDAGPKCEPGRAHTDAGGDAACSGYALLCFLGAGYDHATANRYRRTVKRGIDYLLAVQNADGSFPGRNYTQGVCTMALAEAYAMSNDPMLREPCKRAVDIILARQLRDEDGYPLAWNYKDPNPKRIDSSVSGWCVMALKAARVAGIEVDEGLRGAKRWLTRAWRDANPGWEELDYDGQSGFPYTWNPQSGAVKHAPSRASIGALSAAFLHVDDGRILPTLANWIVDNQLPDGYPCNTYYLYYNTFAVFQAGQKYFDRWNKPVSTMLVAAQRSDDNCFNGSWDWEGTEFHGHDTGRLLSTAYCCLCLEVYYRYVPEGEQPKF